MRWRDERQLEHLMGDPEWCDPKMAGWWLYGICAHIGGGWCSGEGPWTADETGRLVNQAKPGKGQRRNLPHLADNGKGVHRPQLREPGVWRDLPHLSNNGQGVHHAGLREPGVLSDEPENEFHPLTMPELVRWFQWLSARIRHVRIVNGDWKRVCTTGAMKTLPVRQQDGLCGVFLDPPYSDAASRANGLYAAEDLNVAHSVREWCRKNGPDKDLRIVLAGFEGEHDDLAEDGWRAVEWFAGGWLQGGYAQVSKNGHQQHRERLWLSPHCLTDLPPPQSVLFDEED